MAGRIIDMRKELHRLLTEELKTPGNWDHIVNQIGMFRYVVWLILVASDWVSDSTRRCQTQIRMACLLDTRWVVHGGGRACCGGGMGTCVSECRPHIDEDGGVPAVRLPEGLAWWVRPRPKCRAVDARWKRQDHCLQSVVGFGA